METELTLRDYIDVLRRRARIVAVALVGALVFAFLFSALQTPQYRSSSRILINQNTATAIFDPVTGVPTNAADRAATNEVELLRSQLVRTEAQQRLGFEAEISARAESQADIVIVTAVDPDPQRSQLVSQTYAEAYLDVRRSEFIAERLVTAEKLLVRVQELDTEIERLGPEVDTSRQQALRDDLADSYDRLTITADLGNNGSARIIDDAEFPEEPFAPRTSRNLALGAVLGLMLGAGSALLLENLDRSIKTRAVIEELLPNTPVLASIPAIKTEHEVVTLAQPEGIESEVFRTLRAGIEFATLDRQAQVIQVTSPGPSAGKTTVAANLAVVMAQAGQKVAVIDADLRRPRLHSAFGFEQVPGISSVIIGRERATDVAHSLTLNNGRLWVFPSGPIPPGPSELLGSERAHQTFASLRKSLDVIIVDSPLVLPVADALVLSRLADVTLLVANARSTRRDDLVRAAEQLEQAGANLVGTVLNQVKVRGGAGHGYGYGYGETSTPSFFGRTKNQAPRLSGMAILKSSELPRFKSARLRDLESGVKAAAAKASASSKPSQPSEPSKRSQTPMTDALSSTGWLGEVADPEASSGAGKGSESVTAPRPKASKKRSEATRTASTNGAAQQDEQTNESAPEPVARPARSFSEDELMGWGDDIGVS